MHDTKFPLVDLDNLSGSRYFREKTFEFDVKVLEKKYNIKINAFTKAHYYNTCSNVKPYIEYDRTAKVAPGQQHPHKEVWQITASPTTMFVENDTSIGASERAKYHWKQKTMTRHTTDKVFVLSKADKKKDMKVSAFLKDLYNPPAAQVFKATALSQKARAGGGKAGGPVTLLKLEQRGGNNRHTYNDMVWRDAGDLNKLDKKAVHYYMPVIGFKTQSKFGANKQGSLAQEVDMKDLMDKLQRANVPGTVHLTVYGVRKADIDAVKAKKNWVNLEDHIAAQLAKLDDKFWMGLLHSELDSYSFLRYNSDIKKHIVAKDSLFLKVYAHFEDVKRVNSQVYCLNLLLKTFMPTVVNPLEDMKKKFVGECGAVYKKYPLLKHLSGGHNDVGAIAEYINLIDSKKVV
jgi:hypothetical protein